MEVRFGPSDQWNIPPETLEYQKKIEELFRPPLCMNDQPPEFFADITQRWIDWGAQNGDKTYLKYRATPLIPPYVLYHNSIHNEKDFLIPNVVVDRWGKTWEPDESVKYSNQKQTISVI